MCIRDSGSAIWRDNVITAFHRLAYCILAQLMRCGGAPTRSAHLHAQLHIIGLLIPRVRGAPSNRQPLASAAPSAHLIYIYNMAFIDIKLRPVLKYVIRRITDKRDVIHKTGST